MLTKEHFEDVERIVEVATPASALQSLLTTLVVDPAFLLVRKHFIRLQDNNNKIATK